MKRQKITVGSILKIVLEDDSHSYGIILEKSAVGIFKIKTGDTLSCSEILKHDILFIVAIYHSAITSGRWEKLGKTSLDERFRPLPLQFIQDQFHDDSFELYNPNTGEIHKSSRDQCLDLECAAVWEAEHVESRIVDYFNGKENAWFKQLRIK